MPRNARCNGVMLSGAQTAISKPTSVIPAGTVPVTGAQCRVAQHATTQPATDALKDRHERFLSLLSSFWDLPLALVRLGSSQQKSPICILHPFAASEAPSGRHIGVIA